MDESYTHLEQQVFAEFRKYLAVCARSHVELTPAVGEKVEKADLTFYQHKSARLKSFKRLDEFRNKTDPGRLRNRDWFLPANPLDSCLWLRPAGLLWHGRLGNADLESNRPNPLC